MYCTKCGQQNDDRADYCVHCGAEILRPRKKNATPWLIAVLVIVIVAAISVLMPSIIYLKGVPSLRGLLAHGGVRAVLHVDPQPGDDWPTDAAGRSAVIKTVSEILYKRARSLGVSWPKIKVQDGDAIVVKLPGIQEKEQAISMLRSTTRVEFRHLWDVRYAMATTRRTGARYTMEISSDEKGDHYSFTDARGRAIPESDIVADSHLIITASDLKPVASMEKDPQTGQAVIALELTPEGRQKFADFTRQNVGEILAIVLDGKILSAPTISDPILDGKAVIRGRFTVEEARTLAGFINARALPVHLKVVSVENL